MLAIIIILSVFLAAICIGVQIPVSRSSMLDFCNDDNKALDSVKVKIGSFVILAINAYQLIGYVAWLAKIYPEDWMSGNMERELQQAFICIVSLLITVLSLTLGILLLMKQKKLVILSSATIIILSVISSLFINTVTIHYSYFSLLPTIVVLASLAIVLGESGGESKIVNRFPILYKLAPFFVLLETINLIITRSITFSPPYISPEVINQPFWSVDFIIDIVLVVIKSVAFFLIFNALIPSTKESDKLQDNKEVGSKKEKLIIVISICVFPLLVWVLSSISKIWLIIASVLLAIAVPVVISATKDLAAKTRVNALICAFAVVIGLCLVAKIMPSSNDCGHPACKENGPFPCYGKNNTCPNYTYCVYDLYCDECD